MAYRTSIVNDHPKAKSMISAAMGLCHNQRSGTWREHDTYRQTADAMSFQDWPKEPGVDTIQDGIYFRIYLSSVFWLHCARRL